MSSTPPTTAATPPAAPAAAASTTAPATAPAAAKPVTTQSLQTDLKAYLTTPATTPAPAAGPTAAAPSGAGTAAHAAVAAPGNGAPAATGTEPSPGATAPNGSPDSNATQPDADPGDRNLWPESARKRVDRLTARRKEAEEHLAAERERASKLEKELAELKGSKRSDQPASEAPGAAPRDVPATDLLAHVPAVKEAREEQQKHAGSYQVAQQLLERAAAEPEAVLAELKASGVDLSGQSPEQVQGWLKRVSQNALLRHSEAAAKVSAIEAQVQQQIGATRQQWTGFAHELMPELAESDSDEYAEAEKVRNRLPWLKNDPQGEFYVACQIEGRRVLEARAKRRQSATGGTAAQTQGAAGTQSAATAGTSTTPPPPAATAPLPGAAAALPPAAQPVNGSEALRDAAFKSGDPKKAQEWVKSLLPTVQTG